VRTLNYRTIRYPGHAAIMKALLHDLRLRDRRELLADILENAVPATTQDVVVIFVTVAGTRTDASGRARFLQETYARKIYSQTLHGTLRSAIQVTTAASLCATLDLLADGTLPQRGFVRQEDTALAAFLANRFGRVYAEADQAGGGQRAPLALAA
jgi:saccharopine dehydrogenase-like NADP-dependent oxidoreductase